MVLTMTTERKEAFTKQYEGAKSSDEQEVYIIEAKTKTTFWHTVVELGQWLTIDASGFYPVTLYKCFMYT